MTASDIDLKTCDWGGNIRRACLRRGWSHSELAARSGVSRSTIYQIQRGEVSQPQTSTLKRIADALNLEVTDLAGETLLPVSEERGIPQSAREFDRSTNHFVDTVYEECPNLFSGWSHSDWDELYSTFGTGGQLTPEGVTQTALRINRKREVIHRLNVLLETHLRDVAVGLIDTLYEMVTAANRSARTIGGNSHENRSLNGCSEASDRL